MSGRSLDRERHDARFLESEGGFVKLRLRRDPDDEPIPTSGEQHAIAVEQQRLRILLGITAPDRPHDPGFPPPDEVVTPTDDRKVDLETLALKLRYRLRQRTPG